MMTEFLPKVLQINQSLKTIYRTENVVCNGYILAHGITAAILFLPLGTSSTDLDISM